MEVRAPALTMDLLIAVVTAVSLVIGWLGAKSLHPEDDKSLLKTDNPGFDWRATRNSLYFEHGWNEIFLLLGCLYFPMVFGIRYVMVSRKPFDLKLPLALWNIIASLLSGYAALHVVPLLLSIVQDHGVAQSLCMPEVCYEKRAALYVFLFNVTKCLEWIDTIFLALRKRNMGFLHLFHHIVTYVYCWHATLFSYKSDCSGIWFAGMNLGVHFVMYGYYGMAAFGVKFKFAFLITILQTLQMFVGLAVLLIVCLSCPSSLQTNWHGHLFAAGMYGVYLYLFAVMIPETFRKGQKKKTG